MAHGEYTGETLPAWSLPNDDVDRIALPATWPERVTGTGRGTAPRARTLASASSTPASRPAIRSSAKLDEAVTISVGEDDEVLVEEDAEGDVSGHGTACASIVRALAPDCAISSVRVLGANFTGSGGVLLAGLRYAVEQGYRRHQHEPLDHEEAVRGGASRACRHRVLPAHRARRLGAQHARRELPVAVFLRDLRRQPRGRRARSRSSTTRIRPSSSSGAASTSTSRGSEAAPSACPGTASRHRTSGNLRADPRQASRADAVSAEERPVPDRERTSEVPSDRAGRPPSRRRVGSRRLLGVVSGAAERNRAGRAVDLRREGVVDPAAGRGERRARVRGRRRRGRGVAARRALPGRPRHRRLGARDADAARHRGRARGSAVRGRRCGGHRLRAERPDGGSSPPRRGDLGVLEVLDRPGARALQPPGDGPARPVREPGGDRGESASQAPARPSGSWRRPASLRSSRASPPP